MIINRRIATAIATSALIFNSFATSAFAASTITVTGNGADSNNTANINLTKSNSVVQNNNANITNNVDVNAKTGGNTANKNTGGDVNVSTGDSTVAVKVQNAVNKNSAVLDCGCTGADTSVNISGNGADSKNKVNLDMTSNNSVFQNNNANVTNKVNVDATTGGNDANKNTGGNVGVSTGDASVGVDLSTLANMNLARIGGGDNAGGALSLWILGNGADSKNNIDADVKDNNSVVQNNDAYLNNTVDTDASTGKNDANKNTGGDVNVETGDAFVGVQVKNAANFNFADLSCGCLFDDLTAKIAGNGADSKNKIDLDLTNNGEAATVTQNNDANLKNKLDDLNASTGYNDANENSGGVMGSDPSLSTGDSSVGVDVNNQVNDNSAGMGVDFGFDMGDLLNMIFG